MISDDFEALLTKTLKKAKTYPPMSAEVVDEALTTIGIRDSPAYRELLLRTNGAELRNIAFFSVGPESDDYPLPVLKYGLNDTETAWCVTYSGAYSWAWHLQHGKWARFAYGRDEADEEFEDDEAMLADAFETGFLR